MCETATANGDSDGDSDGGGDGDGDGDGDGEDEDEDRGRACARVVPAASSVAGAGGTTKSLAVNGPCSLAGRA